MLIQWWVIITIGCIPVEQQIERYEEQVCFLDTKVMEAPVIDKASAQQVVEDFEDELLALVPGSFVVARYEKRVAKKEKSDGKGQ